MSSGTPSAGPGQPEADRVLVFELGGGAWALPLRDVREVADPGELRAVPTVPRSVASVTNHRGEPLVVMALAALLGVPARPSGAGRQLLVIGGDGDEPGRLGLLVDRVLGLAEPPAASAGADGVVRARGAYEGRMLQLLDAARVMARCEEIVTEAQGRP